MVYFIVMIQTIPEWQEGPGLGSNKPLLYPAPQQQLRVGHTYWNLGHNELALLRSEGFIATLVPNWSFKEVQAKRSGQHSLSLEIDERENGLCKITEISHLSSEPCHKEERKLQTTNISQRAFSGSTLPFISICPICH